jgi:hypothetical protein
LGSSSRAGLLGGRAGARAPLAVAAVLAGAVAGSVALGSAPAGAAGPGAHAARTVSLQESGHLHLTSKQGLTLNEEGSASGTIKGKIYIHLHVANNRGGVTAEVNIYPSGGSLTGYGSASYHVVGSYASFSGSLSISRGTGRYAHARASGLRFTGTVKRRNDSVSVRLSGSLSY